MSLSKEIRTERLRIRRMEPGDWVWTKEIWNDFNHSKYAPYDRPLPDEEQETQKLTKKFSDSGLFFSVFLPNDEKMIGYVCFHQNGEEFDLGYCFHSAFQGHGYAFESAKAVMEHLTKEESVIRFTAQTALDNAPSCRLLERLGFRLIGTETVSFNKEFSFIGGNFIKEMKNSVSF